MRQTVSIYGSADRDKSAIYLTAKVQITNWPAKRDLLVERVSKFRGRNRGTVYQFRPDRIDIYKELIQSQSWKISIGKI